MITQISINAFLKNIDLKRISESGGLELRKIKNGAQWYARFKNQGVLIQKSLGYFPDMSISEARAAIKQLKDEIKNGDTTATVKKVCELWLRKKEKEIDSSAKVRMQVTKHIINKFGGRDMSKLTAPMIIRAWSDLEEDGKYDILKRLSRYIKHIATFAINTGLVDSIHNLQNIADYYPAPKVQHRPTIPPEQLTKFFEDFYSRKINFGTSYDLLRGTFYTLLRQKELTSLQWDWIKGDYIEIPAEVMKMRRPHRVPVTRQLKELLNGIPRFNDYIFASPYANLDGEPVNRTTLNRALSRAGYKDILCAHGIRAIGSTWFAQQGIPRPVRESCLAHITGSQVELAYQNYDYLEDRKPVMQSWCDFVERCSKTAQMNIAKKNKAA